MRAGAGKRLAWALILVVALPLAPAPGAASGSDRSRELLDLDCRSDIAWRRVTLFANGTVRVKRGVEGEEPAMELGELGPDRLQGFLRRLEGIDLSEVDEPGVAPVEGEWVETCRLQLTLSGRPPRVFEVGPFDSPPLAVARLVSVVSEIEGLTLANASRLPLGYRPRPGDVLRRVDDALFEVVAFTSDGKGVELEGLEQPLTLYLRPEDLSSTFIELVSRRESQRSPVDSQQ